MRSSSLTCTLILVLAACGGDKNGNTDDSGGNTGPSIQIDLGTSVSAKSIDATATDEIVIAQRAMNLVAGSLGVVATDPGVVGRMVGTSPAPSALCWTGPVVPQSAFLLDFSPCSNMGMSGGVNYAEPPNSPITWKYNVFTMDESRQLEGTFGFDGTDTERSVWALFGTSATDPDIANNVPLGATVDGQAFTVSMLGGASINLLDANFTLWSSLSVVPALGGDPVDFTLGGTDLAVVEGLEKPATALRSSITFGDCRCPTGGEFGLELDMDITSVSFDIDDLKASDDGVDDPVVDIEVLDLVSGAATVNIVACGEYETTFTTADTVTVTLSGADLASEIDTLCDNAVITDTNRCVALQSAANAAGEIEVTVPVAKLENAAARTVEVDFDNAYCRIN